MGQPRTIADVARLAPLERRGLVTLDEIRECLAVLANEVMALRRKVESGAPRVTPTVRDLPPTDAALAAAPTDAYPVPAKPLSIAPPVVLRHPAPGSRRSGRAAAVETVAAAGRLAKSQGVPRESNPYPTRGGFRGIWFEAWDAA